MEFKKLSRSAVSFNKNFCESCKPQEFSFPNPIIRYILKNPSSSKVYKKLIQICKYFFTKNPILAYSCLHFSKFYEKEYFYCTEKCVHDRYALPFANIMFQKNSPKIWIHQNFVVCYFENQPFIASSIIPKLYKCDATYLALLQQILTFDEFIFLTPNVKEIEFNNVVVKRKNDEILLFEEIVKYLPKVKILFWLFNGQDIAENTVKGLLKIEHVYNIEYFSLRNISTKFDFATFADFMDMDPKKSFALSFHNMTDDYKIMVQIYINKYEMKKKNSIKVPYVTFS